MAYAEGVVRGHVYGGSGWQDCSRPCMWLDGGYCRLKKTAEPKCLSSQPEEDYPEAKYGCKAVVRVDVRGLQGQRVARRLRVAHHEGDKVRRVRVRAPLEVREEGAIMINALDKWFNDPKAKEESE